MKYRLASLLLAVAFSLEATCSVTLAVRQLPDCVVWAPPLGDSPTFVAGQSNIVTWDPSIVPAGACMINAIDATWSGCGIGVPNGSLATNVDPTLGIMTLKFPPIGTGAINVAFYIVSWAGPDASAAVNVVSSQCASSE